MPERGQSGVLQSTHLQVELCKLFEDQLMLINCQTDPLPSLFLDMCWSSNEVLFLLPQMKYCLGKVGVLGKCGIASESS